MPRSSRLAQVLSDFAVVHAEPMGLRDREGSAAEREHRRDLPVRPVGNERSCLPAGHGRMDDDQFRGADQLIRSEPAVWGMSNSFQRSGDGWERLMFGSGVVDHWCQSA